MAVPVQHSNVPTIAWQVELSGCLAGDFNNDKHYRHLQPTQMLLLRVCDPRSESRLKDAFALPSELGKVAAAANARMLILAHRTNRTRPREPEPCSDRRLLRGQRAVC